MSYEAKTREKLGDSLSGKSALERKPRVWLNILLLVSMKNQKVRIFNHTEGSVRSGV